jgi:chorismate mutase/prephenate dehydrogenase
MNLQELRSEINRIDAEIVALLAQRQALMPEVARQKKEQGLPIFQPEREAEVLARLEELARREKVSPVLTRTIFSEIFNNSKEIQQTI